MKSHTVHWAIFDARCDPDKLCTIGGLVNPQCLQNKDHACRECDIEKIQVGQTELMAKYACGQEVNFVNQTCVSDVQHSEMPCSFK